jgi:predicted DNA-binding transcriptional regulator AlpA
MTRLKPTKVHMLQPGDRFLSAEEAAGILGTTVNTLSYYRAVGSGPRFYKFGRSVRYLLSDLAAWGTSHCVEPRDAGARTM